MDTIVSDYGLAELLDLPEHQGASPDVTPKGRAAADELIEILWRQPVSKRIALALIIRDYWTASNEQRERRLDEERA